jgi:hypothetical protein
MTMLDYLLNREVEIEHAKARLFSRLDQLNDSLARVRACIAEIRNVNRHAITNKYLT